MTDFTPAQIEEHWDKTIAFFEAGAPHFTIDMVDWLRRTRSEEEPETYGDSPVPQLCGTAGCIAGVVYAIATGRGAPSDGPNMDVSHTAKAALGYSIYSLGMPLLFSPFAAPADVTAAECVEALRSARVNRDLCFNAWKEVREARIKAGE